MNECEWATSSRDVRYSLLYTSYENMFVVKNKFVFRE